MSNNDVFTTEQLNISNWTKNGAAFTTFSNSFENGVNTLTYMGGDGYERIYTKINVEANTDYEICIRFHSPTGFEFGGYNGVNKEQFFVTTYNPNTNNAYTSIGSKLAESDNLSNSASDTGLDYVMSFNSGSNTELYVSIDFGQMKDGSTVTLVYEIPMAVAPQGNKYLIRDATTIYTVTDGVLQDLETADITAELFRMHGMEEPPLSEILLTLTNPKVLVWSDEEQQHVTATITATPYPQTLYSPDYDMTDATILGIEKVIAVASDDVTFSISFDSGETWKYYTGTDWATLSEDTSGMTAEAIMAVPTDKWAEVATTGHYMVRVTLPGVESTLESFVVDYINK